VSTPATTDALAVLQDAFDRRGLLGPDVWASTDQQARLASVGGSIALFLTPEAAERLAAAVHTVQTPVTGQSRNPALRLDASLRGLGLQTAPPVLDRPHRGTSTFALTDVQCTYLADMLVVMCQSPHALAALGNLRRIDAPPVNPNPDPQDTAPSTRSRRNGQ
jgi:hypothetical protein